jgi:outer membrane murein-binding lipoprotein Lpp
MTLAMSEGIDPQGGEIEVSPEEERFLKRFFRRQVMPWFAVAILIGVTAAWGMSGGSDEALEVRVSAAIAQLRSENERLRHEVEARASTAQAAKGVDTREADELERRVESAKQNVRMIEARVTAELDRRLDALESRANAAPVMPTGGGSAEFPSDAAAWDVSAILERLYALEMRLDGGGISGANPAGAGRVTELERRLEQLESQGASPIPASAAD